MNVERYLNNHIAVTACNQVNDLCSPLRYLGLSYFSLVRIYPDHSRISICNYADWQHYFYTKFLNEEYSQHHVRFEKAAKSNPVTVWSDHPENEAYIDVSAGFGLRNGVVFTEYFDDYTEICHFASDNNSDSAVYFCLGNQALLKKFIVYIKEKASGLIADMEKDVLISPEIYRLRESHIDLDGMKVSNLDIENFIDDIKLERYYFTPKNSPTQSEYLTLREHECLNWVAKGKTAKEIGEILGISHRTVEVYIDKVKSKMQCYKLTKLIYDAIEQGLIAPY